MTGQLAELAFYNGEDTGNRSGEAETRCYPGVTSASLRDEDIIGRMARHQREASSVSGISIPAPWQMAAAMA